LIAFAGLLRSNRAAMCSASLQLFGAVVTGMPQRCEPDSWNMVMELFPHPAWLHSA
jgi:hypothetical protein